MERKAVALLGKAFGFWEGAWHEKILYRDARTPVGVQRRDAPEIKASNYDGWLFIEHEDIVLSRIEGMRRSVALLKSAMAGDPGDYALPET